MVLLLKSHRALSVPCSVVNTNGMIVRVTMDMSIAALHDYIRSSFVARINIWRLPLLPESLQTIAEALG